ATGTSATNVAVSATVLPTSVTVSNVSKNYIFTGSGRISGAAGLTKQGAGQLIFDQSGSNDFTGGIVLSAGTLQIGSNDMNGNIPVTGTVSDNSSLVFNRIDDFAVSNVISGNGTVTKNNTNILTLSGANTYTGAVTIAAGTLRAGNASALGN